MAIEIRLLGAFSARRDGEEIPPAAFGGRLTRRLVRILLTRRGSFLARDALIEALWPRTAPADPVLNLSVLVNRARSTLGDPALILTGSGGYSFARTERCVVDAEKFLATMETGRTLLGGGDVARALVELRSCLDRWGGEPLPEDAYEDWAQEYRVTLLRARLDALELGAEAALAADDPRQAIPFAELAVMQEPLREPAHLLLARALAASGDVAGALAALDRLRRRLADELGLDPTPEADALHTRILRGEGLGPRAPQTATAFRTGFERLPFVGRENQIKAMLGRLGGVDDLPEPVLVSGPPGVGKSRLLEEFALRCPSPVLAARAFAAESQDAWALARSLLREVLAHDVDAARAIPERAAAALADVVPELAGVRTAGSGPDDPESRRALALEGATRLVEHAAAHGLVLVADDLQWADATSLAWLGRVAGRVPRAALVVAYRPEDVPPEGPVASFLSRLAGTRGDPLELSLGPLSAGDIAELVEDEDVVRAIVTDSDATPLAVGEVLGALAARGAVEEGRRGGWRAVVPDAGGIAVEAARAGQRRAIRARVRRHTSMARQTLALLALLRREAPARVPAAATRRNEAVVLGELETLARARLVRLGEEGWGTDHDVVAEVVADDLTPHEAARLHGLLATALRVTGADPADWSRHVLGAGDPEGAAGGLADAARARLERFANDEAGRLASAGLELTARPGTRSDLLDLRAEARGRTGDLAGATADLRAALVDRSTGPERSRILVRLAMLLSGPHDYVRARDLVAMALTEAGDDAAARARALALAARLELNLNHLETAGKLAAEALGLFEELGDAYGITEVLENRAVIVAHSGRIREAVPLFQEVARRFEDAGRLLRVGMPRASRGHGLILMGRPADGLACVEEALELERTLVHPEGEAYCLWIRCEALAALGRAADARESAETALSIVDRMGHREWTAAALKGLGAACMAGGDLEAAEAACRACLGTAERLPIFSSWAASQLASVLIRKGDLASAEPYVRRALCEGTPLTRYEAGLARAELAFAGHDPEARSLAAEALDRAELGGHLQSAARLRSLLAADPGRRPIGNTPTDAGMV
ncbi:MAG: BTAD domain-containing putative transcriptional regulator [Actinomycetota bacterium]